MNPAQRWLAMLAFIHGISDGGVASKRVKGSDQIRTKGNDLMWKNSSNTSGRARKNRHKKHVISSLLGFSSLSSTNTTSSPWKPEERVRFYGHATPKLVFNLPLRSLFFGE